MLNKLRLRLRALFFKSKMEDELDEEVRFHLEREIEENIARGMTPEEARSAAMRSFGGVERVKEESRDVRGVRLLEEVWQDLRYGARMLSKKPGFTLIAIITLALGIGANTAIFSVVNAVLLEPLPYRAPEELVLVRHIYETKGTRSESVSYADFQDWRAQNQVFADLALFRVASFALAVGNDLEQIRGANVSANFFELLGLNPIRGRAFLPVEETPGGERVALISHALWQRVFGANEELIGRQIKLGDQLFTVVGILPPEFKFPFRLETADIWTTYSILPVGMMGRGARNFQAIARLKRGVSPQAAQAEMSAIARQLEQENPATNRNLSISVVSAHRELTKDVSLTLWLLFGAVAFVLLIACANVANLLLARALSRHKEMAVRAALGASGRRIAQQLLTESLLLAGAGGALGLLLAAWGIPLLLALSPQNLPRINAIGLNGHVLSFTLLVSILTGALFGLAPALKVARPDLIESLKEGGKASTASARRNRLRAALVVGEIAVALVLLVGAGLLINSFIRLNRVELGFKPENVLSASLNLSPRKYPTGDERIAFVEQARERIRNLPGVRSVSFASSSPFMGGVYASFGIRGRPGAAHENEVAPGVFTITPDYFEMLGIPLLRGRPFTETYDKGSAGTAIINETFARQFFPNENPLGKSVILDVNREKDSPREFEVVGVVGDIRRVALDGEPGPEIYMPYQQSPWTFGQLMIRTEQNALSSANAVRQQIRSLDPDQTVPNSDTLENLIFRSIMPQRFNLVLLGVFAAIGLLLTLVGVYGVMSYHVAENTREIGIRVALGAQRRDILKLIVGQGLALALIGVVVGLAGALGLTRLMDSLLFGVTATDPLTFGIVASLFGVVALLACWIPARRAAKVDPMIALRSE
jgi:putative ABC transport system permease protein